MIAGLAGAFAAVGILQCLSGWAAVRRFAASPRQPATACPPITVLKPLHGDEPLLEEGLATFCRQTYPAYQVVFGVKTPADPALAAVRRLQARFPECDIAVVINPTEHGSNGKVGNLINMLPAARHPVLVIADSDLHVHPDYLERLAAALEQPGTGLVTTLYVGLPAENRPSARLGATQITHAFLPGALLARRMGRQDCLGATMMVRRETLERIGGFQALVRHLADDNVLGRLVREAGCAVRLADTVPLTTVPEATFQALLSHELRWARTIRALVPGAFAASCLQYPIAWAALAAVLSGGAGWTLVLLGVAWVTRAAAARGIDHALSSPSPGRARPLSRLRERGPPMEGDTSPESLAFTAPVWLLPLRDLMSIGVMVASYFSRQVAWRGHVLHADDGISAPSPLAAPPRGTATS